MGSIIDDKSTPRVCLTRKVVRDFVEHNNLPGLNGVTQPIENRNATDASSLDKHVHDSKIRGECDFFKFSLFFTSTTFRMFE